MHAVTIYREIPDRHYFFPHKNTISVQHLHRKISFLADGSMCKPQLYQNMRLILVCYKKERLCMENTMHDITHSLFNSVLCCVLVLPVAVKTFDCN